MNKVIAVDTEVLIGLMVLDDDGLSPVTHGAFLSEDDLIEDCRKQGIIQPGDTQLAARQLSEGRRVLQFSGYQGTLVVALQKIKVSPPIDRDSNQLIDVVIGLEGCFPRVEGPMSEQPVAFLEAERLKKAAAFNVLDARVCHDLDAPDDSLGIAVAAAEAMQRVRPHTEILKQYNGSERRDDPFIVHVPKANTSSTVWKNPSPQNVGDVAGMVFLFEFTLSPSPSPLEVLVSESSSDAVK